MSRSLNYRRISAAIFICATAAQFSLPASSQPAALTLNEKSKVSIVLPQNATLPEQTAAGELDDYLTKITGGDFVISNEPSGQTNSAIYVGNTAFAKAANLTADTLTSEEWRVKTHRNSLVLVGGGTRGTLYATYHFLEDVAGVRWWNPWEERVPSRKELRLAPLDKRGKPAFNYRDIYSIYGNDNGRFAARNRINRDGDAPFDAKYGGAQAYGPPYHVHTFFLYLPPDKYFKDHPDWYSVSEGGEPMQLNLSSMEMRAEILRQLKENIRKSAEQARAEGRPAPEVFSISHADNVAGFNSPADKALSEREGSQAAPLLDFVNYLADNIKTEFPNVFLDTLAYQITEPLPKTIRPRDNVIIRLTNTTSNSLLPLTSPRNNVFHDLVKTWGSAAKNLRIWDYHVNYSSTNELPYPSAQHYGADYRYLLANNVRGVFTEFEYPEYSDLRDYKLWIMMKQLEDPTLEYSSLAKTFTDGFYGVAGADVLAYVRLLEAAARAHSSDVSWWMPSLGDHNYLTLDFYRKANALFDSAVKKADADDVLVRRVRHARLSLDRSALLLAPRLRKEWEQLGHTAATFPLDMTAIANRYIQTREEQARLRMLPSAQEEEIAKVRASSEMLLLRANATRPAQFRDIPAASFHDITPDVANLWDAQTKLVKDPASESGFAVKRTFIESDFPKYALPFETGFYDRKNQKTLDGVKLTAEMLNAGYQWVKIGTFNINNRDKDSPYIYFFWSWAIQFPINDAYDSKKPADQKYDVWARVRAEGPMAGGKADAENAFYVERIAVIEK